MKYGVKLSRGMLSKKDKKNLSLAVAGRNARNF